MAAHVLAPPTSEASLGCDTSFRHSIAKKDTTAKFQHCSYATSHSIVFVSCSLPMQGPLGYAGSATSMAPILRGRCPDPTPVVTADAARQAPRQDDLAANRTRHLRKCEWAGQRPQLFSGKAGAGISGSYPSRRPLLNPMLRHSGLFGKWGVWSVGVFSKRSLVLFWSWSYNE